jgi:zinc transport system permease protein
MMMITSGIFSSFFTVIGLIFSYIYDITSGASIIMVSAIGLLFFLLFEKNR